jgi:gamma-glutamylcyclotransferase (GGCT)/AIG2-like uncharacterized protein YtfP
MLVFVYGSLLNPRQLARRAGEPRLVAATQPAWLAGYRRGGLRHSRYPTLRRDPRHVVQGAVARIGAAALRRLSAWEGPRYRLCPMIVDTKRGPCRAGVWIAQGATKKPWRES